MTTQSTPSQSLAARKEQLAQQLAELDTQVRAARLLLECIKGMAE